MRRHCNSLLCQETFAVVNSAVKHASLSVAK